MITFEYYRGAEGLKILAELAALRIGVFREFPYLYDGDLEYESEYLGRYFASENSFVFCARAHGKLVGATTAIWLRDEAPMIKDAYKEKFPVESVVYFGESLVLAPYRKQGLGVRFFEAREAFAKSLRGVESTSFCAVIRRPDDARRPHDYYSPEQLWQRLGYKPVTGMETQIEWKELGENTATPKRLQFWFKKIA